MTANETASLAKINFMYYPFATHNRNRIFNLLTVLYLILSLMVHFPRVVWGESDSDYAAQFQRQGMEAQQRGEFGKALFYYSRAEAYLPDDPAIRNDLGLMYEQLGRLDEAEGSYREAIEKDIRYLPAYSNLGILLKKRGRYELAVMYLKRRIDLGKASDPWMMNAQEELEDLYRKAPHLKNKRTLESASELEHQIAQDKNMAKAVKNRRKKVSYELEMKKGLESFKIGDYETAIASFEDALRLFPASSEALHALGRAKVEARKAEIADSLQISAIENRHVSVNRELNARADALEAPKDKKQ